MGVVQLTEFLKEKFRLHRRSAARKTEAQSTATPSEPGLPTAAAGSPWRRMHTLTPLYPGGLAPSSPVRTPHGMHRYAFSTASSPMLHADATSFNTIPSQSQPRVEFGTSEILCRVQTIHSASMSLHLPSTPTAAHPPSEPKASPPSPKSVIGIRLQNPFSKPSISPKNETVALGELQTKEQENLNIQTNGTQLSTFIGPCMLPRSLEVRRGPATTQHPSRVPVGMTTRQLYAEAHLAYKVLSVFRDRFLEQSTRKNESLSTNAFEAEDIGPQTREEPLPLTSSRLDRAELSVKRTRKAKHPTVVTVLDVSSSGTNAALANGRFSLSHEVAPSSARVLTSDYQDSTDVTASTLHSRNSSATSVGTIFSRRITSFTTSASETTPPQSPRVSPTEDTEVAIVQYENLIRESQQLSDGTLIEAAIQSWILEAQKDNDAPDHELLQLQLENRDQGTRIRRAQQLAHNLLEDCIETKKRVRVLVEIKSTLQGKVNSLEETVDKLQRELDSLRTANGVSLASTQLDVEVGQSRQETDLGHGMVDAGSSAVSSMPQPRINVRTMSRTFDANAEALFCEKLGIEEVQTTWREKFLVEDDGSEAEKEDERQLNQNGDFDECLSINSEVESKEMLTLSRMLSGLSLCDRQEVVSPREAQRSLKATRKQEPGKVGSNQTISTHVREIVAMFEGLRL